MKTHSDFNVPQKEDMFGTQSTAFFDLVSMNNSTDVLLNAKKNWTSVTAKDASYIFVDCQKVIHYD